MGEGGDTLLLRGAAGSGKTNVKDLALANLPPEVSVIQCNCYQPERNIPLRPWTGIMEGLRNMIQAEHIRVPDIDSSRLYRLFPQLDLSDGREVGLGEIKELLKVDAIFHTLYSVLEAVAVRHPVILVFEDLQWMDTLSLSVLSSLILHKKSRRFMFFLTAREV